MEIQAVQLGNKGMWKDTSISKSSNEFAYDNQNIRITAVNDETMLSVTNEKGPQKIIFENDTTYTVGKNKISYNISNNTFESQYPVKEDVKIKCEYNLTYKNEYVWHNSNFNLTPIKDVANVTFGNVKYFFQEIDRVDNADYMVFKQENSSILLYVSIETSAPHPFRDYPYPIRFRDGGFKLAEDKPVWSAYTLDGIIKHLIPSSEFPFFYNTLDYGGEILPGEVIYKNKEIIAIHYNVNEFDNTVSPINQLRGFKYTADNGDSIFVTNENTGYSNTLKVYKLKNILGRIAIINGYYNSTGGSYVDRYDFNSITNNDLLSLNTIYSDEVIKINNESYDTERIAYSKIIESKSNSIGFFEDENLENEISGLYMPNEFSALIKIENPRDSDLSYKTYALSYYSNYYTLYSSEIDDTTVTTLINTISGNYIGHCICGNQIIIFTTEQLTGGQIDRIYKFVPSETKLELLYAGNLNFNLEHPIESIYYYESENIQKVYFVDGINKPRFVDITRNDLMSRPDSQFDFNSSVNKIPKVSIEKKYDGLGLFPAGTIKYFVTYYNKFGQETHILFESAQHYITNQDRALKVDETSTCSFDIKISNLDENYDFVRIYSAKRTTANGVIELHIVGDYKINGTDEIKLKDTNILQQEIDSNLLYYIGGNDFIAGTIAQKDDTLFLGDLQLEEITIDQTLKEALYNLINTDTYHECTAIVFNYKNQKAPEMSGYYNNEMTISRSDNSFKTFKYDELYRFAIQFINSAGQVTAPVWIGDKICDLRPSYTSGYYLVPNATLYLPESIKTLISDFNYTSYRLLVAETNTNTRKILAQGAVSPTMFNYFERYKNKPYSIASWSFRPFNGTLNTEHYHALNTSTEAGGELQSLEERNLPFFSPVISYSAAEEEEAINANKYKYRMMILCVDNFHKIHFRVILFNMPQTEQFNIINGDSEDWDVTYNIDSDSGLQISEYKFVDFEDIKYKKSNVSVGLGEINWNTWDKVYDVLLSAMTSENIPLSIIPTSDDLKNIFNKTTDKDIIWAWIGAAIAMAAAIVATVFSFGAASVAIAGTAAAFSILASITSTAALTAIQMASVVLASVAVGAVAGSSALTTDRKYDDWQSSLISKGWIPYKGKNENNGKTTTYEANRLMHQIFNLNNNNYNFSPFVGDNAFLYYNISCLTYQSDSYRDAEDKNGDYFTDTSIVTIHSPEIEINQSSIDNNSGLSFRIIGTIPIDANYSDYRINTNESGLNINSETIYGRNVLVSQDGELYNNGRLITNQGGEYIINSNTSDFLGSGFLYQDYKVTGDKLIQGSDSLDAYKVFLWNRSTSLSVGGTYLGKVYDVDDNVINPQPIIASIKNKIFANQRYSFKTDYFKNNSNWIPEGNIETPFVFNSDSIKLKQFNSDFGKKYYYGNYQNVITTNNLDDYYHIVSESYPEGLIIDKSGESTQKDIYKLYDPISIQYKSTPHAVVKFKKYDDLQVILPRIDDSNNFYDYFKNKDIFGNNSVNKSTPYFNVFEQDINFTQSTLSVMDLSLGGKTIYNTSTELPIWLDRNIDHTNPSYAYFTESTSETTGDYKIEKINLCYIIIHRISLVTGEAIEDNWISDSKDLIADYIINEQIGFFYDETTDDHIYITSIGKDDDDGVVYFAKKTSAETPTNNEIILNSRFPQTQFGTGAFKSDEVNSYIRMSEDGHYIGMSEIQYSVKQDNISNIVTPTNKSFLYMAELYNPNFDYMNAYGGTDDVRLQRLNWIPCSGIISSNKDITTTWGDTYYQRYDCLKTYPFTEDDKNGIVDICSFMVETHINLDGRSDVNRGTQNILNARPNTWNILNNAYTQSDNMFKYNILDEKFDLSKYGNQITWSLQKSPTENIDTWTNITLASILNLDGSKGKVNKLLNFNDTIIAFQDTGIASILFNNRQQITTDQGTPIELSNSGKVEGYKYATTNNGCINKWSIIDTPAGIYFIDDYNKSFMKLSKDGLQNVGSLGFTQWFKDNIVCKVWNPSTNEDAFKTAYDLITNDLYVINNNNCLDFNNIIGSFTSFMPYKNTRTIFNLIGNSYSLYEDSTNGLNIYKLFGGDYNEDYNGNKISYSVTYKVNPEPIIDKIFTNIEYIADCINENVNIGDIPYKDNNPNVFIADKPFNDLEVWNEYQYGHSDLSMTQEPSPLKRKFRVFRADIPRDENSSYKLDRIRNPWIYLKLSKLNISDNHKMEFHNAIVKYFK